GSIRMTEHSDQDSIGIAGVYDYSADLLGVGQPHVTPGLAAISGLVDSIASRQVRALEPFAGADVYDIRIGGSDCQRADGPGRLIVKDGPPGASEVVRFPNPAVVDAYIEEAGAPWDTSGADSTASAEGADHAPLHFAIKRAAE